MGGCGWASTSPGFSDGYQCKIPVPSPDNPANIVASGRCLPIMNCTSDRDCTTVHSYLRCHRQVGSPSGICDLEPESRPDAATTVGCGNGLIDDFTEDCDDANVASGDGCSDTCKAEVGFICPGPGRSCIEVQL